MFTCCRALLISGCTRLPMRITLQNDFELTVPDLYLKDGPLRRSSECIAMLFIMLYLKDGPLRSSECIGLFLF